ncbi:MAG: peptide deformylase [Gemmatimonadetes bacterium 21-71-4]|nr:MAG: peptide deformylase [Gemmatimonadetes bacterium 21-71-4]
MSLRRLHLLGSPVLRQRAHEVAGVDEGVRTLIADLFETMRAAKGVGLASNQIGVARRVAVVSVENEGEYALVNPVIIETGGTQLGEEGCLSIPGRLGEVSRATRIKVHALDREGREFWLDADDYFARAIQHENDHLDGVLLSWWL